MARVLGTIAPVVRTLLSMVNQGEAVLAGRVDAAGLRILASYLIPFVVANLGAMSGRALDRAPEAA